MIELRSIWKRFPGQTDQNAALKGVSASVRQGERLAIVGRSASGKSTLINVMCALAAPTAGSYEFDGRPVRMRSANSVAAIELRRRAGYVGQFSDLLGNFNVLSNVKLAANCRKNRVSDTRAQEWLREVDLEGEGRKVPAQLSGGQRQRVSIARALACEPRVLFADEPTGSLDVFTATEIMDLILRLARDSNTTLVLVTHTPAFAAMCERQLCLRDGRVVRDECSMSDHDIEDFVKKEGGT